MLYKNCLGYSGSSMLGRIGIGMIIVLLKTYLFDLKFKIAGMFGKSFYSMNIKCTNSHDSEATQQATAFSESKTIMILIITQ